MDKGTRILVAIIGALAIIAAAFISGFFLLASKNQTPIPTPVINQTQPSTNNIPQPDKSFSPGNGDTITTEAGTTICTSDIVGPNFSPDNNPDTGEIVVSQNPGVQLNFPTGGYCEHFATNLQGQDLTNEIRSREAQQKCRNGTQPCTNIMEYDV